MKRLVVCCDGTWNRPDQVDRGEIEPSNVAKVALAVKARGAGDVEQRMYYHRGVGTGRLDRLRGGIFGAGLSRNIRDAYTWVARNFLPGDELFFFGFSRGAYTVRSLAGFIRNCGILRPESFDRLDAGYRLYRRRDRLSHPAAIESRLFRSSYAWETRIRFIGVWDTVGALGIPPGPLSFLNALFRLEFHDVQLSSWVDNAFQALAIDERRRPFRPSIWQKQARSAQVLEQAWFPGVHVNVGGGYADSGLSDLAFAWMMDKAVGCGLELDLPPAGITITPDPGGEIRDSMTLLYRLWIPLVRRIAPESAFPAYERVHESAYERMRRVPAYRPVNVPPRG
jgi:uncharacterized protein (DUF2235 family)